MDKARFNYDIFTHKLQSAHGFIVKSEEFSWLQVITFTSKVVVSRKRR